MAALKPTTTNAPFESTVQSVEQCTKCRIKLGLNNCITVVSAIGNYGEVGKRLPNNDCPGGGTHDFGPIQQNPQISSDSRVDELLQQLQALNRKKNQRRQQTKTGFFGSVMNILPSWALQSGEDLDSSTIDHAQSKDSANGLDAPQVGHSQYFSTKSTQNIRQRVQRLEYVN
eukprot:614844_1